MKQEYYIALMKRWLHDYNEGHNNDFEHMMEFSLAIEHYEKEFGPVKMNDWRDEQ